MLFMNWMKLNVGKMFGDVVCIWKEFKVEVVLVKGFKKIVL